MNNEPGGHRIQRVPPTERKGRVHTSTVTVAVIDSSSKTFVLKDSDIRVEWFSGTGCGGQYRNKHQNSCRMIHIPTNVTVTAQCRSRTNSYNEAKSELVKRLKRTFDCEIYSELASTRKNQVGSGMRGDKVRTYRFQDDTVKDHQSGKCASLKMVMNGNIDLLWE